MGQGCPHLHRKTKQLRGSELPRSFAWVPCLHHPVDYTRLAIGLGSVPSAILMGRPRLSRILVAGSRPRPLKIVANRSPTVALSLPSTSMPSLVEAPNTWPPLMAPPPRATVQTRPQWSRP